MKASIRLQRVIHAYPQSARKPHLPKVDVLTAWVRSLDLVSDEITIIHIE